MDTPSTVDTPGQLSVSPPFCFLDLDGVLNRLGPEFPRRRPDGGSGARLWVPEGSAKRLAMLAEVFEMVWCSAWRGHAHTTMAPLLEIKQHWPHVKFQTDKLRALLAYAGERRWAWIDDKAPRDGLRGIVAESGKLIRPDPAVGLTDQHVEELLAWATDIGPK